jgi:nicotinamide mononucleotide (NMN) deamidase PncC
MAHGARERLGADGGLATTGVAGPDPQDGIAPGTVYVAVAGPLLSAGFEELEEFGRASAGPAAPVRSGAAGAAPGGDTPAGVFPAAVDQPISARVLKLELPGDRSAIRTATTRLAIEALLTALAEVAAVGSAAEHGDPMAR